MSRLQIISSGIGAVAGIIVGLLIEQPYNAVAILICGCLGAFVGFCLVDETVQLNFRYLLSTDFTMSLDQLLPHKHADMVCPHHESRLLRRTELGRALTFNCSQCREPYPSKACEVCGDIVPNFER